MASFGLGDKSNYGPDVEDAISHNRLLAYSLETNGKLTWELGDPAEKGPLSDCYFLGPPLPLAGELYVLVEKQQELFLACLDPAKKGQLVSLRRLGRFDTSLAEDPLRRICAAHLAYSDGILVCPTNASVLLGIDLLMGSIAWAYPYGASGDKPKQSAGNEWKASAPILSDGKVVYAPPDSGSLFCLNLRDGSPVWSRKKKDDEFYLGGVYAGIVVIVGKDRVEGIRLASGESLWQVDTGMPSGQGVAAGNVYYLPLRESISFPDPEICAIDLRKGRIIAHLKTRNKEVLGNLLFYRGQLIALTPWEVIAYPDLQGKIGQIEQSLSRNANDPVALSERAELRIATGEIPAAIEDLRTALQNNPDRDTRRRARSLLFEALTELFRRDPHEAHRHLNEFAALGPPEGLIRQVGDSEVKVRRDVWVRGRIAALLRKATPEQRQELEQEMSRRLTEAQGPNEVGRLREGVAFYGDDTAAGREARLRLAEVLMRQEKYFEAELELQPLRRQIGDPVRAARALELLGRLMLAWDFLPDAVYYYRILGRDYAQTTLPDGRTGADVWNAVQTDKRFLPYLDESGPFSAVRFKARLVKGSFPMTGKVFQFEHKGDELSFFRRHTVGLSLATDEFKLFDRATGTERWSVKLASAWDQLLSQQANEFNQGGVDDMRFCYLTLGHLIVLPIVDMVYAIDPVQRRVLWQQDLTSADLPVAGKPVLSSTARREELRTEARYHNRAITYPDGFVQFVTHNVVLTPSALCLVTRKGLQAVEPLTGRLLWTRSDLPARSRIFGDDDLLFVVEQDADGKAVSTRALRVSDGSSVPVPNFAVPFTKRLQIIGRCLLLSENAEYGTVKLRLYDIPTGRDVWKRWYPGGSLVLHSEDPNFTGAVEPNGKVHIADLRTRREVMTGQLAKPKRDLLNADAIHLLADAQQFYLAFQTAMDPSQSKRAEWGVESNVMSELGLRTVPINGMLYAFARGSGELSWYVPVKHQMIVLEQFEELPVILLTAKNEAVTWVGQKSSPVVAAWSIEKRSGKVLFSDESLKEASRFYAVRMNPQMGTIDFISPSQKVTHWLADDK